MATGTQLALFDESTPPRRGEVNPAFKGFEPGASHPGDGPNVWNAFGWGYLTGLLGHEEAPFRQLSGSDAIRQTAFLAICDLIAQDAAKAPLTLRRRLGSEGGSVLVGPREHPLARLFWLKPCPNMTWYEWKHMLVFHLAARNNAYFIPKTADRGRTFSSLIPALPGWVQSGVNPQTLRVMYSVRPTTVFDASQLGGYDPMFFYENEIFHCRTRYIGGIEGMSTIQAGNRALERLDALSKFQQRLLNRDGQYRGVFQMPKEDAEPLSQEQYDVLAASIARAIAQTRTDPTKPVILEQGMTFKETSATMEETEFPKLWDAALSEMARLMRVPPHKFWHLTNVKYENQEVHERNYVAEAILPRCQPFEEKLDAFLLSEDEQLDYYIEFDREALYQADMNALHKRVVEQWKAGLITRDQALRMLGQNPSVNGRVYQMPANTYLLDEQNEVVVAPGGGADAANPDDGGGEPPKPKSEEEE